MSKAWENFVNKANKHSQREKIRATLLVGLDVDGTVSASIWAPQGGDDAGKLLVAMEEYLEEIRQSMVKEAKVKRKP